MLLGKFPLATVAVATSILVTSPPTPAHTGGGGDDRSYVRYLNTPDVDPARRFQEMRHKEMLRREDEEIEAIMSVILRFY